MSARLGIWSALAVLLLAPGLAAEDITLTTYYPSPRGVYSELRTTNDTFLSTQAGSVLVGTTSVPPTNPKFYVLGTFEATALRASQANGVGLFLEGGSNLTDAWMDMGSYNYTANPPRWAAMHIDATPLVLNRLAVPDPSTPGALPNVGIGFNSPAAKLHIRDASGTQPVFRADTDACAYKPTVISPLGYLGVGTGAPGFPLVVTSGDGTDPADVLAEPRPIALIDGQVVDTARLAVRSGTVNGRWYSIASTGGGSPFGQGKFVIVDQGTLGTSNNARMTIDSNGDLGIGTTDPQTKLHVNGSIRLEIGGTEGANKVLKSDGSGNATWQTNYAVYAP